MHTNKHNRILCSERKFRNRFSAKKSKINQLKTVSFSWSLLFIGTLVILSILGISPLEFVSNFLSAHGSRTETINLYARVIQTDSNPDVYDEGWWQTDNAKLNPSVDSDASGLEFNDTNSAIYNGGNNSLTFSAFRFLEAASVENEEASVDGQQIEEDASSTEPMIIEDDTVETQDFASVNEATSSPVFVDEVATSSAEDIEIVEDEVFVEPRHATSVQDVEIEEMGGNEEVDQVSVEEEAVDDTQDEDESAQSSPGTVDESLPSDLEEDNDEPSGDLSWAGFSSRFFTSTEAVAEEFISSELKNLSDLGEFKSATINLSLAMSSLNDSASENDNRESGGDDDSLIIDPEVLASTTDDVSIDDDSVEIQGSRFAEEVATSSISVEEVATSSLEEIDDAAVEEPADDASISSGQGEDDNNLFSFAKQARADTDNLADTKLILWYTFDNIQASSTASSTDTRLWQELDTLSNDNLSNAINGGYLSYAADFIKSWDDIENLKIKIEAVENNKTKFVAFVDSLWITAEYDQETELEKLDKRQRFEEALKMISNKSVFEIGEDGSFVFRYQKNENRIWDTLGEMLGVGDFWKDVSFDVSLYDDNNKPVDIPLNLMFNPDGEITINLKNDNDNKLRPGKYSLKFHIEDNSGETPEVFDIKQDFYWGVLVMNTDRDVYSAGESAYTQMAVLDGGGHTICDADLELSVTSPSGDITIYNNATSSNLAITTNSECGPETVTDTPDYFVSIPLSEEGEYVFDLKAKTSDGERSISRTIKVEESPFTITRRSATRIYPKADYEMTIDVLAKKDFFGDINEHLSDGFKIKNVETKIINQSERDPFGGAYLFSENETDRALELTWRDVELLAGDELEIKYIYDAPDISPELYTAGPLELSVDGKNEYTEQRYWQIASDAVNKRAKTVMFTAGVYNGGATSGQSTNTDYNFSQFNWKLAETGVDIRSAFVVFETQFEAYDSTGGAYTGYKLGFDTCEENCTASAFGTGGGQVLDDNSNTLAYDETESNQVRLLLDVTSEADIAAYTGGGAELESDFGYNIKNGTTKQSIANARATLVVTYEYDSDSENTTNTVSYPLDSTAGADSGSRQASQGACTKNSDCPIFDYNMDIPEFPGVATSSNRLSEWFKVYDHNDSNNANDIDANVNIQTFDVDSDTMHHECANGGTQGNMPGAIYPEWASSGYTENASQQLEYYVNTGNNYLVGGEVFETYIASSSATTKTKTVSFPVGIIDNGGNTNLNSASVNVYFPENGSATGTVKIKKAWFRIKTHNQNSAALNTQISTKVGTNATSSTFTYAYNGGGSVIKPLIDIVHIIPSSDYAELEEANADNAKNIKINATQSATTYGGISAELVITYTYTDDAEGYLTNISLFGGQSSSAPSTSNTIQTASLVMPEAGGKTVYAGGLLSSFLNSDSGGSVAAGTVFQLDANLATTSPSCSTQYLAEPDDVNSYTEFYKDVTSAIGTTDKATYYACYADDDDSTATDGAKMNGILSYTYGWEDNAPTSTIVSLAQKLDGSNRVDISIAVNDIDYQDTMAKLEYATGTSCVFTTSADPSLDETDSNITADFGDPYIENDNEYQIGTDAAYILTDSGANTVNFDWLAGNNLKDIEGNYCLQLTANDQYIDQATPATSTVYIDTLAPTRAGALSLNSRTGTELVLNFGATSTETNFKEYKIFYKVQDGTAPTESDSVLASSTDSNLGDILFNNSATTTISSLTANETYSLAIWTYDIYGNKASSSPVDIFTNDAPLGDFNSALERNDGSGVVDISIEADDLDNNDTLKAKIEYATGTACSFIASGDPSLDEDTASVLADYGLPTVTNAEEYQIGTSSAWILTSPGSNTIDFDWLATSDLPSGDDTYCLGLSLNDSYDEQLAIATTTLTIDNVAPISTGDLSSGEVAENSISLIYASTSPASDTNEPSTNAYKIFYKQGVSGVTESDTEIDNTDLDAYDYNSATSTILTGLDQNTWYVFNIFSYDDYGNVASATEIVIKTKASVSNDSLTFVNPETDGVDSNIALGGTDTWTFRATVSETNGYLALASTTLRLANQNDNISPFTDLAFTWTQSSDSFTEIGSDVDDLVTLDPSSSSSCAGNSCNLDFVLIFDKSFASSSLNLTAELITGNDSALIDKDTYTDFYQVRVPYIEQINYRWRNDDGGE